jgi:hypothetical protein
VRTLEQQRAAIVPAGFVRLGFVLLAFVPLGLVLLGAPGIVRAATPLSDLSSSPDMGVSMLSWVQSVYPHQVLVEDGTSTPEIASLGSLPSAAGLSVTGMHSQPGANFFAVDTPASGGGIDFSPPDLMAWNGVDYSKLIDGTGAGVSAGVVLDAISAGPSAGEFLISWDGSVELLGVVTHPEDLLSILNGVTLTIFFDGSAEGVPPGLNLDAAQYIASTDALLLSFDTSGTIGGVRFDNEDVLEYDRGTKTWELALDRGAEWGNADLVALHAVAAADDNCSMVLNPHQDDTESDTVGNVCDNCVLVSNVGQDNFDGDTEGDACDADDDNDGLDDSVEIAGGTNPLDVDSDDDGVCDGPSLVPPCTTTGDNCPLLSGASQTNSDPLPAGDACQCGDLNDDGVVAIADVDLARMHIVKATISEPNLMLGRCNVVGARAGSGLGTDCGVDDVFALLRYTNLGEPPKNACDAYFGEP